MSNYNRRPLKGDPVLALGGRRNYEGTVVCARRRDTILVQYHVTDHLGHRVEGGRIQERRKQFVWRRGGWIVKVS